MLDNRVSPVFDVAKAAILLELDGDREVRRRLVTLHSQDPSRRVGELSQHAVNVLVCGAISRPLEAMLLAAGICVIPQTCGDIERVVQAFLTGHLDDCEFLMPGCCGRRRHAWRGLRGRAGGGRRRKGPRGNRPAYRDEET